MAEDAPPFPYMRWAQANLHYGEPLMLGMSGLSRPPDADRLGLASPVLPDGRDPERAWPEALAARFGVAPEAVYATAGTSHANFLVYLTLARGGRVASETPAYDAFFGLGRAVGAEVAPFRRDPARNWRIDGDDLRRAASSGTRLLVVTDSWFGNNGLFKPLRAALGPRVHLLSRLRVNAALYACPEPTPGQPGRPRKYGRRLGNAADLAAAQRGQAKTYLLHVYGAQREVVAAEQVVMLKTLRCAVRVVWVYRKTQWVALMTTDLTLSVAQVIESYAARWKIESGFREIKQEIGSTHTQTRNPDAVTNHLHFCMLATAITWIYAAHLNQAPARRYASEHTTEYAFADVRRALAKEIGRGGFGIDCHEPGKPDRNPLISTIMRLVA